MRSSAPFFRAYIAFAQRRAGLLLLGFLALAALTLWPISKLTLATDLAEILPPQHPAVVALRGLAGHQQSTTNLVVLIESPDAAANRRFADALVPELQKQVPRLFTAIETRPNTSIPDYAHRWRWLYAERKDLEEADDLLTRIITERKSPLLVDLEGDPEAELKKLRARMNKELDVKVPRRNEDPVYQALWNEEKGKSPVWVQGVLLWRRGAGMAGSDDNQAVDVLEQIVDRVGPRNFHPQMQIELSGNIAAALDEHNAVRDDLTWSTGICVTLVLLAIYLYFRRIGVILVIGAPAVMGLLLALALARFLVHTLNANTAFLLSIILGNGINSPIILLARYGEERQAGHPVHEALLTALTTTLLATGIAMGAASISYGCLLLTDLRGLSQFGLVGGAGMLLVWINSFLLVPPLVLWGERVRPGSLTPRLSPVWNVPFAALGRLAARRWRELGGVALALCLLAVLPLGRYLEDPLEWDLSHMRSDNPAQRLRWDKMYRVGIGAIVQGYIATDGVILVDRPEQADVVAQALRDKDRDIHFVKEIRTLNSVLPKDQDAKLEILGRIRARLDKNKTLMSDSEWRDLQDFRPPESLRRVTVDDLPQAWLQSFTEVDGTRGRLLGIDLDPHRWRYGDGRALLQQAESMKVNADGKTWVAASYQTVFAGILKMISVDMKWLTLAALCGVTLLTLLAFGLRGALPVLLSVLVGTLWLGGLLALFKLKLNFVNFVALPITLGVGADYAANIWARLRRESLDQLEHVIASTGSAVALCSTTTIIGYSTLLRAGNRALQSFGMLADLGEVCCLLAALLAMPALVRLVLRRA